MNRGASTPPTRNRLAVAKTLMVVLPVALVVVGPSDRARAQEQRAARPLQTRGVTSAGRSFMATARLVTTNGRSEVVAEVRLDTVGSVTLRAPNPTGGRLLSIKITETKSSGGARQKLSGLLRNGSGGQGEPTFTLVPRFAAPRPDQRQASTPEPRSRPRTRRPPRPGRRPRPTPRPTPKPEPKPEPRPEPRPEPKPEPKPAPAYAVEIVGANGQSYDGAVDVLVGEKVELSARIVAGDGSGQARKWKWKWSISGSVIKDYRHDLADGVSSFWEGRSGVSDGQDMYAGIVEVSSTPMSSKDLGAQSISFYFTGDGQKRTVKVTALVGREKLTAEVIFNVARSRNPALDLYTAPGKNNTNFVILSQHGSWHGGFSGTSRFVHFHREFLRAYNAWREIFGYLPVEAVADVDQPGGGLTKPSYLTARGGNETSSSHGKKKLGEFETLVQLGDALESPWHNRGHGVESSRLIDGVRENGDMGSVARAPTREVFFQWHTKVDNVAREWEAMTKSSPRAAPQGRVASSR